MTNVNRHHIILSDQQHEDLLDALIDAIDYRADDSGHCGDCNSGTKCDDHIHDLDRATAFSDLRTHITTTTGRDAWNITVAGWYVIGVELLEEKRDQVLGPFTTPQAAITYMDGAFDGGLGPQDVLAWLDPSGTPEDYPDPEDGMRFCSICDAMGHGYPGGGPCPLEDRGWDEPPEPWF